MTLSMVRWYGAIRCALALTSSRDVSTPRASRRVDLLEQHGEVDDDAVADDGRDTRREDAGGQQVQRVLLVADDDGVPGVVAAVVLHDVVDRGAEQVGRLALALVAPLGADQHDCGHGVHLLSDDTEPREFSGPGLTDAGRGYVKPTAGGHQRRRGDRRRRAGRRSAGRAARGRRRPGRGQWLDPADLAPGAGVPGRTARWSLAGGDGSRAHRGRDPARAGRALAGRTRSGLCRSAPATTWPARSGSRSTRPSRPRVLAGAPAALDLSSTTPVAWSSTPCTSGSAPRPRSRRPA